MISGGLLTDPYHDLVTTQEYRPQRLLTWTPAFDKREVQWIVAGGGPLTVSYDGFKCGSAVASAELR